MITLAVLCNFSQTSTFEIGINRFGKRASSDVQQLDPDTMSKRYHTITNYESSLDSILDKCNVIKILKHMNLEDSDIELEATISQLKFGLSKIQAIFHTIPALGLKVNELVMTIRFIICKMEMINKSDDNDEKQIAIREIKSCLTKLYTWIGVNSHVQCTQRTCEIEIRDDFGDDELANALESMRLLFMIPSEAV